VIALNGREKQYEVVIENNDVSCLDSDVARYMSLVLPVKIRHLHSVVAQSLDDE
jgi:hypothetical protein